MGRKFRFAFSGLIYTGILLLVQLPVYQMGDGYCTIYELYSSVKETNGAAVFSVQMGLLMVYQLACVLSLLAVFLNKNWRINLAGLFLGLLQLAACLEGSAQVAENFIGRLFPLILVMLNIIECLIPPMLNAMKEAGREAQKNVEKDRAHQAEKKRRLHFEGKYPKLFYKLVWENFIYYKRDYLLFVTCGGMTITVSFVGLGAFEMLSMQHESGSFLMGTGLGRIVFNALVPIEVCSVILMVAIMITYLKRRFMSYSMLLVLGARKKTAYNMLALEVGFSFVFSLVTGWSVGNIILTIFRAKILRETKGLFILSKITLMTYAESLGILLGVFVLAFLLANEIARDFNIFSVSARNKRAEKLPQKGIIFFLAAGLLFVIWSIISYSKKYNFEDIKLVGICLFGVFLLIRYGLAFILKRGRRSKHYLSKLMEKNQLYYRSRTTSLCMFAITFVNTCVLFYFSFQAISVDLAESEEELFPYDYMCIADEDDQEFFQKLEEKYAVHIKSYPMVRVTSSDGTSGMETTGEHSVQGQHIGISETTYQELRENLGLKKKELPELDEEGKTIYVVYQQDHSIRSQPLDFQFPRSVQRLHIGLPCKYYNKTTPERLTGFPKREIVGEEIGTLTGCFRQGTQENIVVFSDAYFKKAEEMWKTTDIMTGKQIIDPEDIIPGITIRQGPTRLVLIKADPSQINVLEKEMEKLRDNPNHKYEEKYSPEVKCYYSKQVSVTEMNTERLLRKTANYLVVTVLVFSYVYLLFIKSVSEMEERRTRAKFLRDLGMAKKDRHKVWRKEVWRFFGIPGTLSILLAGIFTYITFYLRSYPKAVIHQYFQYAVLVWGFCILAEFIATVSIYAFVIHKVEGKMV